MGSFAANSGSSATMSAEGSDDVEETGKMFLRPVLLRSFLLLWCKGDPSLL